MTGPSLVSLTVSEKGDSSTLVAAYQVLDQVKANQDITTHTGNEDSLSKVDGLDALVVRMKEAGGGRANVTSNDGVVNYWRFVQ
jgi:hypothetical protein